MRGEGRSESCSRHRAINVPVAQSSATNHRTRLLRGPSSVPPPSAARSAPADGEMEQHTPGHVREWVESKGVPEKDGHEGKRKGPHLLHGRRRGQRDRAAPFPRAASGRCQTGGRVLKLVHKVYRDLTGEKRGQRGQEGCERRVASADVPPPPTHLQRWVLCWGEAALCLQHNVRQSHLHQRKRRRSVSWAGCSTR